MIFKKRGQEVQIKGWITGAVTSYSDGEHMIEVTFGEDQAFVPTYLIDQIDEPEKPVIPQFVADWIEKVRPLNFGLRMAFDHWDMDEILEKWLQYGNNQEIFARAWVDGYEVEKQKLYTVEIPNPHIDMGHITVLKRMDNNDNDIELCVFVRPDLTESKFHLTKEEIKKDFLWAWEAGFAKEVDNG